MGYNVGDLIDLAVSLEHEGAIFYEKLAHMTKNKSTKQIFWSIASDKHKHAQFFLA